MTMTEEEAKTKWCPFVRHPQFGNTQDLKGTRCIASACMAWRWHETSTFKGRADAEFARTGKRTPVPGYCGLAGAP